MNPDLMGRTTLPDGRIGIRDHPTRRKKKKGEKNLYAN